MANKQSFVGFEKFLMKDIKTETEPLLKETFKEQKIGFEKYIPEDINTELQIYAQQLFKNVIFLGNFQETILIENEYRDIVILNEAETVLKQNIDNFILKVKTFYCNHSIGIQSPIPSEIPSSTYRLLTEVKNMPFDNYWFQIRKIRFRENDIFFKIKCIRKLELTDKCDTNVKSFESTLESQTFLIQFDELYVFGKQSFNTFLLWFYSNALTKNNILSFFKLLGLLIISILSGILYLIQNIGTFTIHFMEQFNNFIRVTTPIFIVIIEFFSKIVGGLYILLAMLWRDTIGNRRPTPNFYKSIEPKRNQRAIQYSFQNRR